MGLLIPHQNLQNPVSLVDNPSTMAMSWNIQSSIPLVIGLTTCCLISPPWAVVVAFAAGGIALLVLKQQVGSLEPEQAKVETKATDDDQRSSAQASVVQEVGL